MPPPKTFEVDVQVLLSVACEVEATSKDDAERIVTEGLEHGGVDLEIYETDSCVVIDSNIKDISIEEKPEKSH